MTAIPAAPSTPVFVPKIPAVINHVLGDLLTMADTEFAAYRTPILAAASKANFTIENAVDAYVNSLQLGGSLSFILTAFKSQILTLVNNAIESQAVTKEDALFDLILSAGKNEAAALLAAK